jgi:UDP-N-acetylmuramoyl-L-alanyl-D-glutamate--2,6-diaminopimelate ligase
MDILKLLEGLKVKKIHGPLNVSIKGITYDSRLAQKDFLFVAVRGFTVDGHDYIKDAINRGATAIIGEIAVEKTDALQIADREKITYIEVPDSREALALLSTTFYGHPSKKLSLIGITGTNGKTTTSFITKSIIEAGGNKTGLLGTICYITGYKAKIAVNTTPESLDIQQYLYEMVNNNMKYAILEVSSHALSLRRVEGCSFKVAAFTNFSQDHLDFHGSMDEYFRTKVRLFDYLETGGTAVLNQDDPMIRALKTKLNCNVITCGLDKDAVIRAENIEEQRIPGKDQRHQGVLSGLSFDVLTPGGKFRVNSKFIGRFNIYNLLMSVGISCALGINNKAIQKGLEEAKPVEGRFENIDEGQNFLCIVDYAHTEDALVKLIQEARHITKERIITVFGCGGNRDKTKRPLMGYAASELSDIVVITSDNPRGEDPDEIIRDIVKGIKKNNYVIYPDREIAIKEAVSMAKEGDTLLVAGKGHENYQEIKGVRYHFSDKETLRKEIKSRLASG